MGGRGGGISWGQRGLGVAEAGRRPGEPACGWLVRKHVGGGWAEEAWGTRALRRVQGVWRTRHTLSAPAGPSLAVARGPALLSPPGTRLTWVQGGAQTPVVLFCFPQRILIETFIKFYRET